jgi:hypothetical protein
VRWIVLIPVLLAAAIGRAETATIHLTDGSQVRGEVVSLKGGTYTVEGEALGTLQIPQEKIRLVEYGAPAGAPASIAGTAPALDPGSAIEGLQRQLLANPAVVQLIQSLQADPEIRALVSDAALQQRIQQALMSGNLEALMNDPQLLRLLQNPKVQAITGQVQSP